MATSNTSTAVFPPPRKRLQVKRIHVREYTDDDQNPIEHEGYALVNFDGEVYSPKEIVATRYVTGRYEDSYIFMRDAPQRSLPQTEEEAWKGIEEENLDLVPSDAPLFEHEVTFIDGGGTQKIVSESAEFFTFGEMIEITSVYGRVYRINLSQIRIHITRKL